MLKEGDFIYLFNEKATFLIPYRDKSSFSTHKGSLKLEGGLDYGDSIVSNSGEVFHILRPTTSDFMFKVKRRTTIIYPKEAGTIILELSVVSGSRVIEIGTGSGSFTYLLSSLVGEKGRVYSFERREEHQEIARKNLQRYRCADNVEFFLKDPAAEGGFGVTGADAAFVDVPEPWTLVPHCHAALCGGGHIGVLSPNIEQVQATVEQMKATGFANVRCQENWSRGIRIKKNLTRPFDRMIGHTGYLLFAEKVNKPVVMEETAPEIPDTAAGRSNEEGFQGNAGDDGMAV